MKEALELLTNPAPMNLAEILIMCFVFTAAFWFAVYVIKIAKRRRLKEDINRGIDQLISETRQKYPRLRKRGIRRKAYNLLRQNWIKNNPSVVK